MSVYIALLRGVNVGGNNTVSMPQLKETFQEAGFTDVQTYINSGNVLFLSNSNSQDVQAVCESLVFNRFGLQTSVAVITAAELADALAHAPKWWGMPNGCKHNAIFVIAPASASEVCAEVGEIKPAYENVAYYGKLIFWSAPMETFSRTRWSKVSKSKTYQSITIRNSNTAFKLMQLAEKLSGDLVK